MALAMTAAGSSPTSPAEAPRQTSGSASAALPPVAYGQQARQAARHLPALTTHIRQNYDRAVASIHQSIVCKCSVGNDASPAVLHMNYTWTIMVVAARCRGPSSVTSRLRQSAVGMSRSGFAVIHRTLARPAYVTRTPYCNASCCSSQAQLPSVPSLCGPAPEPSFAASTAASYTCTLMRVSHAALRAQSKRRSESSARVA